MRRLAFLGMTVAACAGTAVAASLALAGCDKPTDVGPSVGTAPSTSAPDVASWAVSTAAPSGPAPSASATPAPDTIIAQHVLVAYRGAKHAPKTVTRSKAEAKARAEEALAKVRAGAAFEDVVKQYSDDAATVDGRGSLGKFRRDGMDAKFSATAFALKVGEVSEPVETPFGFHVIKRTQ